MDIRRYYELGSRWAREDGGPEPGEQIREICERVEYALYGVWEKDTDDRPSFEEALEATLEGYLS